MRHAVILTLLILILVASALRVAIEVYVRTRPRPFQRVSWDAAADEPEAEAHRL